METMKKRKYTKRTPRQFMEAIREMVNVRGAFHVSEIGVKHFGYRQVTMSQALAQLGWTARQGNSTVWTGTRPKDEKELRAMAMVLIETMRTRDLANTNLYRKKGVDPQQVKAAIAVIDNPAPAYVSPEPVKAKRAPKRKKFSILWGLFKWEK